MIISKTPLRVSFVGGGSDLASFYEKSDEGGAVVTTTINKYVYVIVNKKFDDHIRVSYSATEEVSDVSKIEHPIVREVLKKLGINGVEITSIADIPSRGTGLGSSSAFTAGLISALLSYQKKSISPNDLANLACEIEIDILKEPIGKQDQFGTVFGGLKFLTFHPDGSVSVDPISCLKKTKEEIEKNILLMYTGITRSASRILVKQKLNLEGNNKEYKIMKRMVKLAYDLRDELKRNKTSTFGQILHQAWMYKKEMADGISSEAIDDWYNLARKSGASGGKILGAGGGGFLLLYAPLERHAAIKQALANLKPIDFRFEEQGTQIKIIH